MDSELCLTVQQLSYIMIPFSYFGVDALSYSNYQFPAAFERIEFAYPYASATALNCSGNPAIKVLLIKFCPFYETTLSHC